MEYPQDWVVTTKGKVVRRDKAKANDVIEEQLTWMEGVIPMGIPNTFQEKEDAFTARDNIIDKQPNAFLQIEEPKKKPGPKSKAKAIEQDEFRELLRSQLMERFDSFWTSWEKLGHSDKCSVYTKLLLFAYSKAPNEKVVDPADAIKRKADAKRQAAADKIAQGLDNVEDTDFEE